MMEGEIAGVTQYKVVNTVDVLGCVCAKEHAYLS